MWLFILGILLSQNSFGQLDLFVLKVDKVFNSKQNSQFQSRTNFTPLTTPQGSSNNLSLNIGIEIGSRFEKGFWINGISYETNKFHLNSTNSGANHFTQINQSNSSSKIEINSNFDVPLYETEKVLCLAGIGANFGRELESRQHRESKSFDELETLQSTVEETVTNPKAWEVGLNARFTLYYRIKNIGLGIGLNNTFSIEFLKGSRRQELNIENSNGNKEFSVGISELNSQLFLKRFNGSVNIAYFL